MERTIKQISSKLKNKFVLTVYCLLRIVTSKLELGYMQTVSYNHIGRFTRKLFGYQNIGGVILNWNHALYNLMLRHKL